jgi:hypothetical protein
MAGARCSVWAAHHHVDMNDGLSLIERDIAACPNHFMLTVDQNLFYSLRWGSNHHNVAPFSAPMAVKCALIISICFRELPGYGFEYTFKKHCAIKNLQKSRSTVKSREFSNTRALRPRRLRTTCKDFVFPSQ